MTQELLAGAAIGSIITLLIMVVWHRSAVAYLLRKINQQGEMMRATESDFRQHHKRLFRIINQFKDGKSGTAKLAVKIARGEVA